MGYQFCLLGLACNCWLVFAVTQKSDLVLVHQPLFGASHSDLVFAHQPVFGAHHCDLVFVHLPLFGAHNTVLDFVQEKG